MNDTKVFYKAIVCSEPTGYGGIKIRIPEIHGVNGLSQFYTKTEELPYAYPASQISCEDYGQSIFPLVGTQVYVAKFDNSHYIYFGSALPNSNMGTTTSIRDVFLNQSVPIKQPYVIVDSPYQYTVFKSFKGSTIEISDQDTNEFIRIVGPQGGHITLGNYTYVNSRRGSNLSTLRPKGSKEDINYMFPLDSYIDIDDGKGNSIKINKDGVTINCKKFKLVAEEKEGLEP